MIQGQQGGTCARERWAGRRLERLTAMAPRREDAQDDMPCSACPFSTLAAPMCNRLLSLTPAIWPGSRARLLLAEGQLDRLHRRASTALIARPSSAGWSGCAVLCRPRGSDADMAQSWRTTCRRPYEELFLPCVIHSHRFGKVACAGVRIQYACRSHGGRAICHGGLQIHPA